MIAPSPHAIGAMLIAVTAFWFFASGRVRIEIVSLVLIAVLAISAYFFPIEHDGSYTGLEIAFGGFGHEALIAICALMILGRGLVVTGALEPAGRLLTRLWKFSRLLGLLFSLVVGGVMSMFVNDTPVLVLTMPIMINLAIRAGIPASKTLMPMNCAILIGGMATTIGTSTNLLVVSIAEDLGLPRFGIFHFTDVALLAALVALPYLWLVMPRLLPAHSASDEQLTRRFRSMLFPREASPGIGQSLQALRQRFDGALEVVGAVRKGSLQTDSRFIVEFGDAIEVEGTSAELQELSSTMKMPLVRPAMMETVETFAGDKGEGQVMAELVIGAYSSLIGQTIRSAQVIDRYGVAVMGLHHPEQAFFPGRSRADAERLEVGDVLWVQGGSAALEQIQISEGTMILEGAAEIPRTAKAGLALLIFAGVVLLAALHLVPIAVAALAGSIVMLATGCVKFDRLGQALSAKVIVLVAASIALGRALLETGAAEWLGSSLALGMQGFPGAVVLAIMMAFATLLTNFSSNTAAAAVGTPIAVSLAEKLAIPAEPLVLAVLFGCNLCYATPIAYQTNILIMSAGGYHFRDYVRAGLPLVLLMICTLSVLLVWKYQL